LDSGADKLSLLTSNHLTRALAPFYLLSFFLHALRLARNAGVILSHWMIPSGFVGACVSLVMGKPHIVIEHSGGLRALQRLPGGMWLTRFILAGSCRVITVSEELRERLIEWVPDARHKTIIIPMGVDYKAFMSKNGDKEASLSALGSSNRPVIFYLGRLSEVKGVDHLIRAVGGLKGAELVIAGDGEQESELKLLADQVGVRALFLGRVGDAQKRAWLRRSDVVVVPSVVLESGRTEGMPVVCLEAMAASKPVIASRVGGLPEVIRDGKNGLLVGPGDVAGLRRAIERVLNNEVLRGAMGVAALQTAKRFDWDVIATRFENLIQSAIHERRVRHN